jgi:hypothetical protein
VLVLGGLGVEEGEFVVRNRIVLGGVRPTGPHNPLLLLTELSPTSLPVLLAGHLPESLLLAQPRGGVLLGKVGARAGERVVSGLRAAAPRVGLSPGVALIFPRVALGPLSGHVSRQLEALLDPAALVERVPRRVAAGVLGNAREREGLVLLRGHLLRVAELQRSSAGQLVRLQELSHLKSCLFLKCFQAYLDLI